MKAHILFDLDGTLVDSASTILASFERVLKVHGLKACREIDAALIGPPLRQTLATLVGKDDPALLDALSNSFREIYDSEACLLTPAYADFDEVLKQLGNSGVHMYIATNKRLLPTQKIIAALGWDGIFRDVLASDSHPDLYQNKSGMISALLSRQAISPQDAVYIGDTPQDGVAAAANSVEFWPVGWGYGHFEQLERPLRSAWDVIKRLDQDGADG